MTDGPYDCVNASVIYMNTTIPFGGPGPEGPKCFSEQPNDLNDQTDYSEDQGHSLQPKALVLSLLGRVFSSP